MFCFVSLLLIYFSFFWFIPFFFSFSLQKIILCLIRFQLQSYKTKKIQCLFRGYFTRTHWDKTYLLIKTENEKYKLKIINANKMRRHILTKVFRQRFKLWRKHASELKVLRRMSCLKIQTSFRRYSAIKSKKQKIYKIRQTNKKYLIMCEYHHSFLLYTSF